MLKCITFDGDVATLDMLMDHLEKIERALTKVNEQLYAKRVGKPIFLREGNRIIRLHPDEILYVEGYGDYVRVHRTNNKPLLSQNSLKSFEECLGENDFVVCIVPILFHYLILNILNGKESGLGVQIHLFR